MAFDDLATAQGFANDFFGDARSLNQDELITVSRELQTLFNDHGRVFHGIAILNQTYNRQYPQFASSFARGRFHSDISRAGLLPHFEQAFIALSPNAPFFTQLEEVLHALDDLRLGGQVVTQRLESLRGITNWNDRHHAQVFWYGALFTAVNNYLPDSQTIPVLETFIKVLGETENAPQGYLISALEWIAESIEELGS